MVQLKHMNKTEQEAVSIQTPIFTCKGILTIF